MRIQRLGFHGLKKWLSGVMGWSEVMVGGWNMLGKGLVRFVLWGGICSVLLGGCSTKNEVATKRSIEDRRGREQGKTGDTEETGKKRETGETGEVGETEKVESYGKKGPKPWSVAITVSAKLEEIKKAALGVNVFAADMWTKLPKRLEGQNAFISPWSISMAFGMAYAGARKDTEKEMRRVLHFDLGQKRQHAAFGAMTKELSAAMSTKNYELVAANSLWPDKKLKVLPSYVKLLERRYGVGVRSLNYAGSAKRNKEIINGWIKYRTKGKIPKLLTEADLPPLTRLVLVNTIYFKGTWEKKFKKRRTQKEAFHLPDGQTMQVPMMSKTDSYQMLSKPTFDLLRLPYKGKRIVMDIILPKDKTGLAQVEKELVANKMDLGKTGVIPFERVWVKLPRFKMRTRVKLGNTLKALGLDKSMNLQKANFSGIAKPTKEGLAIDDAIHEAMVEVTEEGTVAAAATALMAKGAGAPSKPKEFHVDHPFLFQLRDNVSGVVLFVGRVVKPKVIN